MSLRCAALVVAALLPVSADAAALPFDHLKCRRVEDAQAASRTAEIASLPFGLRRGCTVKGSVREVCEPAAAGTLGDAGADAAAGESLATERLCYRVRCDGPAPAALQASDRFGTRPVSVGRAMRLCVAAAPSH